MKPLIRKHAVWGGRDVIKFEDSKTNQTIKAFPYALLTFPEGFKKELVTEFRFYYNNSQEI